MDEYARQSGRDFLPSLLFVCHGGSQKTWPWTSCNIMLVAVQSIDVGLVVRS